MAIMARLAAEVAKLSPADAAALPRFLSDRRKLAALRPVLESARLAGDLRERPHHRAADGQGPRPATGLGRAQHHGAPRLRPCPSRRRCNPLACFVRAYPARPVRKPVNAISHPEHGLPVGASSAPGWAASPPPAWLIPAPAVTPPAHLHDGVCHESGANKVIRSETGMDISDHMVNIFTIWSLPRDRLKRPCH